MPKDYQISQYDLPFCRAATSRSRSTARVGRAGHRDGTSGAAPGAEGDALRTRIGITRIHLEEDTGKMVHVGGTEGRIAGATHSLVDFNRAGTPLMELVTEPDIRTPEEARRFAQKLRSIWLALGVSDCNMEEGSMRVDANVSVRLRGEAELGTKSEVKNMNSFKALHDALAYEIVRQAELLEAGGAWCRRRGTGTRARSARARCAARKRRTTTATSPSPTWCRSSSSGVDRAAWQPAARTPGRERDRYMAEFGLPKHDATLLAADFALGCFFEEAVTLAGATAQGGRQLDARRALGAAERRGDRGRRIRACRPRCSRNSWGSSRDGAISGKQAKEVFADMAESGDAPGAIVERAA